MSRIFNFAAGPATLPESVLEQARDELLDWRGTGMGVMEMSHRDKPFMSIAQQCEDDVRSVLGIPADYKVLFMQGGASAQFGVVPQNLLHRSGRADYVVHGAWGEKAMQECAKFGEPRIAASSKDQAYTALVPRSEWSLDPDAAYVHITTNETVHGVQFPETPEVGNVPLVADMSSDIASRPVDIARYGLIYAGAQKNIGPSGITLVIVRDSLLGPVLPGTLSVHDYRTVAANDSMLNTPPCFAWYMVGLVFQWIRQQGGVEGMQARNRRKSGALYDYLESEPFYTLPVAMGSRSNMNVVFRLPDEALNAEFVKGAEAAGLSGLKGHRMVGGLRASLYNALPEAAVLALIDYLKEFARTRG